MTRILANLVLEDTVERIYYGDVFAETWKGLFLIRGENVVLLGEVVCTDIRPQGIVTYPVQGSRQGGRCTPAAGRMGGTCALS